MAQTTDQLVQGSACLNACIPDGAKVAVMIYLLQQIGGNTQTTDQLIQAAACINSCITGSMQMAVAIYLLQQISAGGGVGGGLQAVTYAGAGPVAPPPNAAAIAIAIPVKGNGGSWYAWDVASAKWY